MEWIGRETEKGSDTEIQHREKRERERERERNPEKSTLSELSPPHI